MEKARGAFETLLRSLGIHRRPLVALLRAFARVDLRHQANPRAKRGSLWSSPLMIVLVQLVGASVMSTAVILEHVNVWAFAFISYTLAGTMLGLVLLADFGEILLDDADLQVIAPHPVPWQTYLLARALNLGAYAAVLGAALNIIPCLAGLRLKDSTLWFVPVYAMCAAVLTALVVAGVVVVSHFALSLRRKSMREVLAMAQVAPLLLVFYGGQALWNDTNHHLQTFATNPPYWVRFSPIGTLAGVVKLTCARADFPAMFLLAITAGLGVAACLLTLLFLALSSPLTTPDLLSGTSRPRPGSLRPPRSAGTDPYHHAGFTLARTMLQRDPDLTARIIPYLGMSLGALVLSFAQGRTADPFSDAGLASAGSFLSLYVLVLAVPTIVQSIAYSRDAGAGWALQVAPIARPERFVEGACSAVERRLLYPAFAVLGATLAILWRAPLHALVHIGLGVLAAAVMSACTRAVMVRALPFSRTPVRLETLTSHLTAQAVAMALCTLCSLAHARACASAGATAAYGLLLGIVFVLLNTWSRARLAKSLTSTLAF